MSNRPTPDEETVKPGLPQQLPRVFKTTAERWNPCLWLVSEFLKVALSTLPVVENTSPNLQRSGSLQKTLHTKSPVTCFSKNTTDTLRVKQFVRTAQPTWFLLYEKPRFGLT